ncbi:MAG TPA: MFS transporter [Blastocatellia bacterium]|nr:MFS transporter [Blastocatellia bacterium]
MKEADQTVTGMEDIGHESIRTAIPESAGPGIPISGSLDGSGQRAVPVGARLDRLPATAYVWKLIVVLSLGGFFEIYDIYLTGSISPALIHSGIFHAGAKGLFGLTDQATFASVTFLGLFIGTVAFASVADRYGRRPIFTFSLLWYAAATAIMAFQNNVVMIDVWRFIAGIGIGVEIVTIDGYIAELVPKYVRGRAFAVNHIVQFTAVPVVALLSWQLTPLKPFGLAGWRWVALVPVIGAMVVWWIRRSVPESPRWLEAQGRIREAELALSMIETRVAAEAKRDLAEPRAMAPTTPGKASLGEILRPPFTRRTNMLILLNFFQAIGFYGFNNWVPALMESRGASFVHSLQYSFFIAMLYPVTPFFIAMIADRIERKWQVVIAAIGVAAFGLTFAQQSATAWLISLGGLLTVSTILLSYSFHAYMSEIYPTQVRARAVGFVYSFSRLSTVFSSFMIAFFLQRFGTIGVFGFIAFAMLMVVLSVGILGTRTGGQALEEIAQ